MHKIALLRGLAVLIVALVSRPLCADGVVLGPVLGAPHAIDRGDLLLAELNCAACHRGTDVQSERLASRRSPVLGKDALRITPQYLRKFLNDPAGFKPGTTMPNMLHGISGEERATVVDSLVHFLVSEQDSATEQGIGAEEYQIRQGRALYHTIGCVACHEPQASPEAVPGLTSEDPKLEEFDAGLKLPASVPLGDLARKTTVEQLAKFLVNPLKVRPSGRMPSHNLTPSEAASISVYLLRAQAPGLNDPSKRTQIAGLKYEYFEENFGAKPDFSSFTPKTSGTIDSFSIEPRKREQLFGFRYSGSIKIATAGRYTFFVRSDDGAQLFIDGKMVVDNSGEHAPEEKRGNIELTEGSHSIIVTFHNNGAGYDFDVGWRGPGFNKQKIPAELLTHSGQPMVPLDAEEFVVNRDRAARGRELFASLGCASCHEISGRAPSGRANTKSLRDLPASEGGCLAERPSPSTARFDLSAEQRKLLINALAAKRFDNALAPRERVAHTLAQMNCLACHTRDGQGGPSDARLAYFRMNGEVDMGDEGRIPPHLTAVGGKLKPEWTREVLMTGGRVRPYMATRMPQFGEGNIGHLPAAFERADLAQERADPNFTQRDAKFGRRLAGAGGLVCISCHNFAGHKSLGIPAIDLARMASRLRYDWFHRYLVNPPSLRPGTRMPSFWPEGEAANKEILEGNTEAQIQALWAYLASKPETDLPAGLIQGKKEIIAETEPVIYRHFIQGAGTRAIGVGYPEKVNLAFDANNQRLAMIWQGSFIDASRHSSGRGEGFEPPLGNNIVPLPEGPQFAELGSGQAAWPKATGREAGFKTLGYSLDEKRRPTFSYEFKGARIEEFFEPVKGEIDAYFKRTLRIHGTGQGNLWFRAAAGDLTQTGDTFLLNNKIQMKFSGSKPVLREADGQKELLVPVQVQNGVGTIVQEIIW